MHLQQLLSKKNIFLGLITIAVFVLAISSQLGWLEFEPNSKTKVDTVDPRKNVSGTIAILDGNVIVTSPLSNNVITSPLAITGRARVFEATVSIRLKDADENIIATDIVTASNGAPNWGTYTKELEFESPLTKTGWLEVYTQSAKDGSDQDLVRMPLVFADFVEPMVQVYFSNIEKDPELLNCETVYPVERQAASYKEAVISSINFLLGGLTDAEVAEGFVNNLPEEDLKIQNLDFADGIITIDFNQKLQQGVAGSCRVRAIRAQITQTLQQFVGVDDVVISIDGRTVGVLQP